MITLPRLLHKEAELSVRSLGRNKRTTSCNGHNLLCKIPPKTCLRCFPTTDIYPLSTVQVNICLITGSPTGPSLAHHSSSLDYHSEGGSECSAAPIKVYGTTVIAQSVSESPVDRRGAEGCMLNSRIIQTTTTTTTHYGH